MNGNDATAAAGALGAFVFFGVFAVMMLALSGFIVWCYWKIAEKMGYQPALSLLMLVPLANIAIVAIVAFGRWPIEDEVAALRARLGDPPLDGVGLRR